MYQTEVVLRYTIKTIDDDHCSKQCQFFISYHVCDGFCKLGSITEKLTRDKNRFLRRKLCKKCEATDEN